MATKTLKKTYKKFREELDKELKMEPLKNINKKVVIQK